MVFLLCQHLSSRGMFALTGWSEKELPPHCPHSCLFFFSSSVSLFIRSPCNHSSLSCSLLNCGMFSTVFVPHHMALRPRGGTTACPVARSEDTTRHSTNLMAPRLWSVCMFGVGGHNVMLLIRGVTYSKSYEQTPNSRNPSVLFGGVGGALLWTTVNSNQRISTAFNHVSQPGVWDHKHKLCGIFCHENTSSNHIYKQ